MLFDKIYLPKVPDDSSGVLGDIHAEDISTTSNTVPMDLHPLLASFQRQVTICARVRHNGVIFASSKTHIGNSLVQFYPRGDRSTLVPGSIKYIYQEQGRFVLAIQRQLPAEDVSDPYAIYPHFPANLYSSSLSQELECVEMDWIYAHYARWKVLATQSVVLSLSRVRHLPINPLHSHLIMSLQE